ncbi:hypothetical protein GOODEAATRI_013948, partial [Goodea atripinnis]
WSSGWSQPRRRRRSSIRTLSLSSQKVYGEPLVSHLTQSNREIAAPIQECIHMLLRTGMREEVCAHCVHDCGLYLVQFLSLLSEQQAVNKMTPSNIAIVLGPNLLWPRAEGCDSIGFFRAKSSSVSSRSGTTTWGSPTPETAANDNAGSSGSPMFESSTVTAPSPSSGSGSGSTPSQIPSPPPRSTVPAPNPGGQMRNLTQRQSLDQVQLEPILEAPPESPKAVLTIGSPYKRNRKSLTSVTKMSSDDTPCVTGEKREKAKRTFNLIKTNQTSEQMAVQFSKPKAPEPPRPQAPLPPPTAPVTTAAAAAADATQMPKPSPRAPPTNIKKPPLKKPGVRAPNCPPPLPPPSQPKQLPSMAQ